MARRLRILFLCTGNSCRSQMAEGWARALKGDAIDARSAGIEAHGLNPLAVSVMAEAGVDIARQRSKTVDELAAEEFDYVVTVCGHANETCPSWLRGKAKVVHVGFDDPPALARDAKTEADALGHYRRVRDEIRAFVERLPHDLAKVNNVDSPHQDARAESVPESPLRVNGTTHPCLATRVSSPNAQRPESGIAGDAR